jgi:hypothetical protein
MYSSAPQSGANPLATDGHVDWLAGTRASNGSQRLDTTDLNCGLFSAELANCPVDSKICPNFH